MTNVLSELQDLQWSRPAVDASDREVAAWYERKATVLEHLAAEGASAVRGMAAVAHQHAARLLAGAGAVTPR